MAAKDSKKTQRIKLRLYGHPVKLDGTILRFAQDGKTLTIEFDGPIETTEFWWYSEKLLTDKEPIVTDKVGSKTPAEGAQIWEVL